MGITCTYPQTANSTASIVQPCESEELEILTPRPTVQKDVIFIWNLDIFKTLMTESSQGDKEKHYEIKNVYDNPLIDTGQNERQSNFSDDPEKYSHQTNDTLSVEEKQRFNKLASLCRKVKKSYCEKCRQNIDDLIKEEKRQQWSNVKQNMEALRDKVLSEAITSLQIINSRSSCVNILYTTSHLIPALAHVLLFQMGNIFKIENIYSTANIGKEKSFKMISEQFGNNCNVFVFGVGKDDEKIAEKLKMAFWKVADQSDVDSLHHALKMNYL
ncbi:eyes absent homolog 1 [Mytilus galloprovincialis]|uniref:Eyes absent homolog n=1 Tax=Mytilus galloprovincialis TaxID=29158 RepID=A0A8B6BGU9_MYTGA|nr:eyes absent homolog 1 [Mytilus galloprovincialis]